MNTKQNFINVVTQSRVLSREQKMELLTDSQLSTGYKEKLMGLLLEFDKNSKAREAYLRDKMEELYTKFIAQLDAEKIGEETKKELLGKAKKQMESFFPTLASV